MSPLTPAIQGTNDEWEHNHNQTTVAPYVTVDNTVKIEMAKKGC